MLLMVQGTAHLTTPRVPIFAQNPSHDLLMTGYGKASGRIGSRRYTAELRSLNGKQLDLSVRMPSAFRAKEMELRKQLGTAVGRGKCDLSLQYAVEGAEPRELNKPLIDAYVTELSQLAAGQGFRKGQCPAGHGHAVAGRDSTGQR